MKKILAVLFCSLVVTLTGCVNAPFKIDPVATAKAPWKVGEKIVDEGICSWDNYYREFLGVNKSGLALVQEFYLSGEKFTDPFLMPIKNADKNEVSSCRENIEGVYTTRYKNGQKWMEGNMKSDKWVGIMRFWDEKGNLIEEKDYGIPED